MEERIELKRSLINKVKEYPEIWDNDNSSFCLNTQPAWNEIQRTLNYPLKQIRDLWAALRNHYFEILMSRTIERSNRVSKWKHFHDMSFMYENVKRSIEKKMGGLSPPLLKQSASLNGAEMVPCLCCIPTLSSNHTEKNASSTVIVMGDPQLIFEPVNKSPTEISQDDSQLKGGTVNTSSTKALLDEPQLNSGTIKITSKKIFLEHRQLEVGSVSTINRPEGTSSQSRHPAKVRKRRIISATKDERGITRAKLIDTVKCYPVLYAKMKHRPKNLLSQTWKLVAKEVGLPIPIIQNRWGLYKRRYLEELTKQRSVKGFKSHWENFEQMSFMYNCLESKIEDLNRMRDEIEQVVKEQKKCQTIDLCSNEDDTYLVESNGSYHTSNLEKCNGSFHASNSYNTEPCSYQQIFINSVESAKTNLANKLALCDRAHVPQQKTENVAVITLDLSSDEEKEEETDIICLDDDESMITDSSMDAFDEDIVHFSEFEEDDTVICIDEDN